MLKNKIWTLVSLGILILFIFLSTPACSQLSSENNDSQIPGTMVTHDMSGDSKDQTISAEPTNTILPTQTLISYPTKSPTARTTSTPFPSRTLRPTWTPSPTLSPTATKEFGWIIKDDFSEVTDAWLRTEGENWATGLARGGYFISVNAPYVEVTSSQSWLKLDDARVIMDVYRQHGQGYWGISCRETASGSYYTIFLTSEGQYGYGETRNTRVELMILGNSAEIKTGLRDVNHVIAECRGNHLRLTVNDNLIFQQKVEGIGPGWVGMMAGTMYDQQTVTVIFDNIEIWGPLQEDAEE